MLGKGLVVRRIWGVRPTARTVPVQAIGLRVRAPPTQILATHSTADTTIWYIHSAFWRLLIPGQASPITGPGPADRLTELFEDAVAGGSTLTGAFDALAAAAGGTAAILFCPAEGRAGITGSAIADEVQRAYVEFNWGAHDRLTVSARKLTANQVILAQELLPQQLIETSVFFTDFLEPFDMMWAAGWGFVIEDELWCLGVTRGKAQGPFEESDRALLQAVAPRISRAIRLLTRTAALFGAGICASLDVRQRPYIVIDHRGLVAHVSPTAATILAGGVLSVRDGRLFSTHAETNDILETISVCARVGIRGAENLGKAAPAEFIVPRTEGHPIIITTHRMRDVVPYDILPGGQILLRLVDVDQHPMAREHPVRLLFNLSPREIEIARRLSVGEDPATIAETLGLKASYVRQVVKSILSKTGLKRINQLIAMLARFPDEA